MHAIIPDHPTSLRVGCAVRLLSAPGETAFWACTLWWEGTVLTRRLVHPTPPSHGDLVAELRARPEAWEVVRCAPAPTQP